MKNMSCSAAGCSNEATTLFLLMSPDAEPSELAYCKSHIRNVGMDYFLPSVTCLGADAQETSYEECRLYAVIFMYDKQRYALVMKSLDSRAVFVTEIGYVEACAIYHGAKKTARPNPLAHELIASIVQALGGSLLEAVLYGYDSNTQAGQCYLSMQVASGPVKVKCRISDAVAISISTNMPVKINKAFLGREGDL